MNALPYVRLAIDTPVVAVFAKATGVVVLAALATRALPRLSAARRHLIWFAALVACATLVVSSPIAPNVILNIPVSSPTQPSEDVPVGARDPRIDNVPSDAVGRMATTVAIGTGRLAGAVHDTRATALAPTTSFLSVTIVVAWIVGCMIILARAVLGHLAVARLVRQSRCDGSFDWAPALAAAAEDVGVRRRVRILLCPALDAPVTSGFVHPVILLPVGADAWTDERRRAVLVHELAHIARADYVTQLVGLSACAVLWFHPLVWFALARLRAEAEGAADDRVLMSGMPGVEYAGHLLDLARATSRNSLRPVVTVGVVTTSRLERRFEALLDDTRSRATVSVRAGTLATSLTLAAVVPVAGLRIEASPRIASHVDGVAPVRTSVPIVSAPSPVTHLSVLTKLPSPKAVHSSLIAGVSRESAPCERPDSVAFRVNGSVNGSVNAAELRAVAGIAPGMKVDQRMVARAIRNLYATKKVDDNISTTCQTIGGKSVLVFNVTERGRSGAAADANRRVAAESSTSASVLLDEIVAVIGDQPITRFELQQRVLSRVQTQDVPAPASDAAKRTLEQETLDRMMDEELVLQKAKELGTDVPDSEVVSIVERQIRDTRGSYATEGDYEKSLVDAGLGTPDEYRRYLIDQFRRRMTLDRTRARLKRE